uniref:Putative secreted protein n=1 Tax=Anopheles marajoara TaxID=58244 RepID=A0A2M4CEX1_9DIPT
MARLLLTGLTFLPPPSPPLHTTTSWLVSLREPIGIWKTERYFQKEVVRGREKPVEPFRNGLWCVRARRS